MAGGGSFISFPLLMFTGVPPVQANSSNTVALWPGLASSVASYWRLDVPRRLLVPLLAASMLGAVAHADEALAGAERRAILGGQQAGVDLIVVEVRSHGQQRAIAEEPVGMEVLSVHSLLQARIMLPDGVSRAPFSSNMKPSAKTCSASWVVGPDAARS